MGALSHVFDLISGNKPPKDADEAIERFQKETDQFIEHFELPWECDEAADALNRITGPYSRLLNYANRCGEGSESYDRIFKTALIPTLDKISSVSTSHQCFKNKRFKKSFDRFIQTAQKKARDKDESD